jgi:predicted nucleic acid-binding protein
MSCASGWNVRLASRRERRGRWRRSQLSMSLADACLVRMTETVGHAALLTTDADFRLYRRHGRQAIPCVIPS